VTDYPVQEAAKLVGVNHKTIRRRLHQQPDADGRRSPDSLPNAYQVNGEWRIPHSDLIAAGWSTAPVSMMMAEAPRFYPDERPDHELLEALHAAETRAAVAEAQLAEVRGRLADKDALIEALRQASK
jgi:hypothetical protein